MPKSSLMTLTEFIPARPAEDRPARIEEWMKEYCSRRIAQTVKLLVCV